MNFKLYFKYILLNNTGFFFKNIIKNKTAVSIFLLPSHLYYLTLHIKLSSFFYSTQLSDIFVYETVSNTSVANKFITRIPLSNNSILVYNFHHIIKQHRFFIFVFKNYSSNVSTRSVWTSLNSISELFLNAN